MATIFGTSSIDNLFGTAGADSLVGLAGNDVLFGGAGSDTFDGGVGSDTANYAGLGTAITLRDQGRVDKGVFGSDRLENMEKIIGAVGFRNVIDGTVSGSQVTNFFVDLGGAVPSLIVNNIPGLGSASFQVVNFVDVIGTANNDTLLGDAQANLLSGAGGDDSLNGRAGNDILQGGTGSDTLNGGDGFDTANYSALGGPITLRERGRVDKGTFGLDSLLGMERIIGAVAFRNVIDGTVDDPQSTSFFVNLGAEQLLISGIPTVGIATFQVTNFVDVIGTSNNDVLIGSAQANLLSGGGGNDALIGGAGNDTLDGGTGNDRMAGDAGNDFFVVDGAGDSVSDSAGTDTILLRTGSINLSGIFVENVTGDIVGQAFSITGNSLANVLTGGVLADTINASTGNDTIFGGNGNDNLTGGADNDLIDGGAGLDWANYADLTVASQAVTVNLVTGRALGAAGADTLAGIENILTGAGNDSLLGDSFANMLSASAGNDTLDGGLGNDTMSGGAGNDVYVVDSAGDSVSDSAGTDTILLRTGSINLSGIFVENVTGDIVGQAFSITGNSLANALAGAGQADTLNGGGGTDTLAGGLGADSLFGGTGRDQFVFNSALDAANVDRISDYSTTDDTIVLDDAVFTALGSPGTLAAGAFKAGAAATDADDRIIYNTSTGALLYDADGSGSGLAIQFATLSGLTGTLNAAEFIII